MSPHFTQHKRRSPHLQWPTWQCPAAFQPHLPGLLTCHSSPCLLNHTGCPSITQGMLSPQCHGRSSSFLCWNASSPLANSLIPSHVPSLHLNAVSSMRLTPSKMATSFQSYGWPSSYASSSSACTTDHLLTCFAISLKVLGLLFMDCLSPL